MRGARISIIGIALLLLMSVSAVNCQNGPSQNVSDQKIISDLNDMRLKLLTVLDATIPVKDHFDKTGSTLNSVNKAAGKINTYMDKNGKVLAEMMDSSNILLNDTFEDPSTNIVLDTDYAINREPLCSTLTDTKNQEQLKVCDRCNVTSVWQNQTVWDLKTGNVLVVKSDCSGNITESALQKRQGLPPAAPVQAEQGNPLGTSLNPIPIPVIVVTQCANTGQSEV